MAKRMALRFSGSISPVNDVLTAIIPHPISTPTAAGTTALIHGITAPTFLFCQKF